MNRSDAINELATALAKAQAKIRAAPKDNVADVQSKTGRSYKYSYSTLADVWEACRAALSENGLAVVQTVTTEGPKATIHTLLVHSSGQWIEEGLSLTAEATSPQAIGSCITYGRRYALGAMVGVVSDEDDDGAAASRKAAVKQVHTDDTLTEKLQASLKRNGNGAAAPRAAEANANGAPPTVGGGTTRPDPSGAPQVDPHEQAAADLIAVCEAGFKSKDHKLNWFRKHVEEINKLGKPWAQEVVTAYHKAAE